MKKNSQRRKGTKVDKAFVLLSNEVCKMLNRITENVQVSDTTDDAMKN